MKIKLWIVLWFLNLSILLIVGLFNYIIDPDQQYRKATLYPLPFQHARELNAGLAKNYESNSVLIGTSMMQSFSLNDVENILDYKKPIKLVMPGSSIYEQQIMLNTALRRQKIDEVLIGIDFLSFYGSVDRLKYGESFFPFYLYDENVFNDYKYLFSIDTLQRSIDMLSNRNNDIENNPLYDYSKMYEWGSKKSDSEALKAVHSRWNKRKEFDKDTKDEEKKLELMVENFDYNLLPLIKENQNIEFILFFPPYSILAQKIYLQRDQLDDFIEFKKYIVNKISGYKNVKAYDFQLAYQITNNLTNYRDLYHYKAYVNKWMLEQMKLDKYRVDKDVSKIDNKSFIKRVDSYKVEID